MRLSVLDLEGILVVTDPAAFLDKVALKLGTASDAAAQAGFGRAKAFGCGLMLLKRAPVEL